MRTLWYLAITVMIIGLVVIGCSKPAQTPTPAPAPSPAPAPGPAEPIKLKLAHSVPPMSATHTAIIVPWTKMIEERTAAIGKPVQFTLFPGGALAKIPEQYDNCCNDQSHVLAETLRL